jgi:F0F1-type ATP synthase membrane subunit b/b'
MSLDPLSQLDWRVMLSVAVIVGLTLVALQRVFVGPYLKVMEARQRLFEDTERSDADSERVRVEAEAEAEGLLSEARLAADQTMADSRVSVEAYRSEHIDKANSSAARRLERGRTKIRQEHDAELDLLRKHAIECVSAACARLSAPIDKRVAAAAVDDAIARIRQ